jgi:hypothetical protein
VAEWSPLRYGRHSSGGRHTASSYFAVRVGAVVTEQGLVGSFGMQVAQLARRNRWCFWFSSRKLSPETLLSLCFLGKVLLDTVVEAALSFLYEIAQTREAFAPNGDVIPISGEQPVDVGARIVGIDKA